MVWVRDAVTIRELQNINYYLTRRALIHCYFSRKLVFKWSCLSNERSTKSWLATTCDNVEGHDRPNTITPTMKKICLFIFLLSMVLSAQAQSFKPDRSAYVQFLTSAGGGSIRGQIAERGFKVMEVYYLLTEHHQIWMFPLTGILYDEQGKYYALWSRYIERNDFFLCDSIVLRNLSTDGNGVWVDMEIHAGELDRKEDGWQLEDNDPPWHRKCKAVGFYLARTDLFITHNFIMVYKWTNSP